MIQDIEDRDLKKDGELDLSSKKTSTSRKILSTVVLGAITLALLGAKFLPTAVFSGCKSSSNQEIDTQMILEDLCPTAEKLIPEESTQFAGITQFGTPEYKNHSLSVWRDAVRLYTPSFDDLGPVGEDSRWDVFFKFENYLMKTFPLMAKKSELVHVNTHGLVFILHGKNETLKPMMLTAHQDVVPVPDDTVPRWKHSPFGGYFDGKFLWGRGSSDCRNNLIGIMEAAEALLSEGFKPERSLILGFGFDEECSGEQGAAHINEYLLKRFGEDSIEFLIDEGGLGIQDLYGSRFSLPATGEKGYVDIVINLVTNGGHSSVPPDHTSIGIISDLIQTIETKRYPLRISENNPFYFQLKCEAKSGRTMDPLLRDSIEHLDSSCSAKTRVLEMLDDDINVRYLASTSQAVDTIDGGLKINALPENVTVKINHRVAYDSSTDEVKAKILSKVSVIAEKYNLAVRDFAGKEISGFGHSKISEILPSGYFELHSEQELGPAPITKTLNNKSWDILSGTIRHVFEDFVSYPDADPAVPSDVTVSPSVMTGNTDTKHYWALTKNLYRFTPIRQNARFNAHAIDERVELNAHIDGVAFYYDLLRNVDENDRQN